MKIHLAYGKNGLEVEVPENNLLKILSHGAASPVQNPEETVRTALDGPIDSSSLRELSAGKRSAVIVICDITRPVPNRILLPPILEILKKNGIDRSAITILIATGLHRPSTLEEIETMVGSEIAREYTIISHKARVAEEQHYFGKTKRGTPVFIDKRYCSAGLKITLGFIEPHLMAGFSGGCKLIAPGCAGEETIKALHAPGILEHPDCREGSIDNNPLHHELLEIARMAGHDFIVNVSLNPNGQITGIFAGHPEHAHETGIRAVRTMVAASVNKPADIVITTSAGYPLDLTYYQAIKGLTASLPAVKKGGMIILAAECAEGLGSPEFTAMAIKYSTADEFRSWMMANPVVVDQWQLEECAKVVRHAEVILVSTGISPENLGKLFILSAATVEEALQRGFQALGAGARVAVIPKGPYTLVNLENETQ
ncbi:MAG: nickel-dependent lactate racemase [bacterium]